MIAALRVGAIQETGLAIYIFDDAHADEDTGEIAFPGTLDGSTLTVDLGMRDLAADLLNDASNSADDDGDREVSAALAALVSRVRRAR